MAACNEKGAEPYCSDLLREMGHSYRDLEDAGYLLVLTRVEVRYKRPARFDDVLTVRTTVARTTTVRCSTSASAS